MPAHADDEKRRLEALRSYGVLDTPPEPAFDRLTALLARLCAAPMAIVSLVDSQRQWFKSVHGADWTSTERAISFCSQAIEQRELYVVEDARRDPCFADNPLVTGEPFLRFYAGMPLVTPSGEVLGTLAVLDRVPRQLDGLQTEALKTLAEQVMALLESRRQHRVLEDALLQRERSLAALRDSESRWRLLFERNPLPMWVYDPESLRFLAVNDAAVVAYGWSHHEFLALTIMDIRPPEDVAERARTLPTASDGLQPTRTWRHRRKDGRIVHVDVTAHSMPFDGRPARLVLSHDVSEHVSAQQRLQHKRTLLELAGRLVGLGGWSLAWPEGAVQWSDELRSILDCPPEHSPDAQETLGWYDPPSRSALERALQACRDQGLPFDLVLDITTPKQRRLAVRVAGQAVRDETGRVVGAQGAVLDQTAQREIDARLHRQAALLDEARDAIVLRDLDDRVTYWNRSAERIFGWSAAEALGQRVPELLREDPMITDNARSELLARGEWTATLVQHHKDGRPVSIDGRWTLLRDTAGQPNAILAIKTDVTRRLDLEAQLQQLRRLEAVGQLTGGVAHDFNNLLTVILGSAGMLSDQLADRSELQAMADMICQAAERGAELTRSLLAFARRQALQPQAVDAHQLLVGMDTLLRRTLPENIELEMVRAAGLWPALVDPTQLEAALLNLVLNARDAMPAGGKITLETANAWIDQDYADRHVDVLPGQYVLLSVSDTGEGMSALHLARAFEPFFTTKGAGKGSGLGLSMVYGFVKQSRGHVKLYSEPGQGTTARIYLPRAEAAAVPGAVPVPQRLGEVDLRGSARVLVVEDDALVRRHAVDVLGGLGYRVLDAENGVAALALLRLHDDIDLLFTDVVMPGGLNGRELADAALQLRPGLRVLYTSGYTENAIVHHGRLDRGVLLLQKPYRSVDLARKVQAALATRQG